MAAKLIFKAEELKRIVEHSLAAPGQGSIAYTKTPVDAPSIILVKDRGIYVMSNGNPGDPLDPAEDTSKEHWPRFVVYAEGFDPQKHDAEDWYDRAREAVGGDDFAETLPWAKQIKEMIDGGYKRICINVGKRSLSLKGLMR